MEKTMYGVLKTTGICPIMVAPEVDFAADAAKALVEGGRFTTSQAQRMPINIGRS